MAEEVFCIAGDGGPLVVLQSSAALQWQGVGDSENSLMNSGEAETDYGFICDSQDSEVCVVTRYSRDMLVLWDSEYGMSLLSSELLSLASDVLIITMGYYPDDLPSILPEIRECLRRGKPDLSLPFHIQDTILRLQVGVFGSQDLDLTDYRDIPVVPSRKRCDVYLPYAHTGFIVVYPVAQETDAG